MMKEWNKLVKFGLVGVLNTAVDFLVFNLLLLFRCPAPVSKGVSYTAGMLNSFFFNKNWTFRATGNSKKQFVRFLVLNLATLAVSVGLMKELSALLATSFFAEASPLFADNLANLIVIAITVILNFIGSRFFVFSQKSV